MPTRNILITSVEYMEVPEFPCRIYEKGTDGEGTVFAMNGPFVGQSAHEEAIPADCKFTSRENGARDVVVVAATKEVKKTVVGLLLKATVESNDAILRRGETISRLSQRITAIRNMTFWQRLRWAFFPRRMEIWNGNC